MLSVRSLSTLVNSRLATNSVNRCEGAADTTSSASRSELVTSPGAANTSRILVRMPVPMPAVITPPVVFHRLLRSTLMKGSVSAEATDPDSPSAHLAKSSSPPSSFSWSDSVEPVAKPDSNASTAISAASWLPTDRRVPAVSASLIRSPGWLAWSRPSECPIS